MTQVNQSLSSEESFRQLGIDCLSTGSTCITCTLSNTQPCASNNFSLSWTRHCSSIIGYHAAVQLLQDMTRQGRELSSALNKPSWALISDVHAEDVQVQCKGRHLRPPRIEAKRLYFYQFPATSLAEEEASHRISRRPPSQA